MKSKFNIRDLMGKSLIFYSNKEFSLCPFRSKPTPQKDSHREIFLDALLSIITMAFGYYRRLVAATGRSLLCGKVGFYIR
jgi:hypothetical protein